MLAAIDLTNFVFYAGFDSNLMDFEASLAKLKEKKIEFVSEIFLKQNLYQ